MLLDIHSRPGEEKGFGNRSRPSLSFTGRRLCRSFLTVPNAGKSAGANDPVKPGELPFEEALGKLEAVVEAMESEDLPLETLLAKYEEGTKLARTCQDKLAEAELRIQVLEKNAAGDLKTRPMATGQPEASA